MPQEFLTTPERLRYQTVPASLLEADIRQHFHLTEADRTFLTPFRGAANRLGLALQLGVLRLMGFLPEAWASQPPPEALAFVATQLATEAAHLVHYGARQQTRSDHFGAVLRHLGFRKWEPLDAAWLEPWLVERALEHDGDRVLLAITCLKLHQARIARPAIGTLERLVGGISDLATQETYRRLAPLLTDEVRQQLDALLLPEAGRPLTRHRWLVQPATVSNPAAIVTALDKLQYLDGLDVASWDVSGLHSNRQKRLALLARSRSNRHLERLPAAKRYPVLVAFLRESYLTLTDEVLSMVDAFWEQSLAKARRAHDQYQQQVIAAKDTALRTLAQAVAIVLDEDQTPAGQVRPSIYAQVPREDLVLAWEAVQTMLYPTRHSHLSFLAKR